MAAASVARVGGLRPVADPNVIPFIDILLVLLVIFMVTAPMPTVDLRLQMVESRGARPPVIEPTIIEVREAPEGAFRIFVGEEETQLDRLAATAMAHVLSGNPTLDASDVLLEAPVYVRSDQAVAYGHVVAAVDALQTARFAKVGVIAQRADE
jgi:biopolymer transport protein ExbD